MIVCPKERITMMPLSVEFHVHTKASKDSLTSPEKTIMAARCRGLDRTVITDQNTLTGAIAANALDPELVVICEEIMTTHGEILAIFVSRVIPPGLPPEETIKRLQDQGAFISVSHPFDSWRSGSWKPEYLLEIISQVDALDVFNARSLVPLNNLRASKFAKKFHLAGTAGSDAHAEFENGAARLELPLFATPDDLRAVIKFGKIKVHLSFQWVHFFSRYAYIRKKVV